MSGDHAPSKPDGYWDRAGEQGYGQAMYRSSDVEAHVRGRVWQTAIDIAGALGVPADGHVLDLGCGDGAFANQMLAAHYRAVDGLDKSETAIRRAQAESRNHATYRAVNLVTFDLIRGPIVASTRDVDAAVREIREWGNSPWAVAVKPAIDKIPADHPSLDPIWRAAADHDIRITPAKDFGCLADRLGAGGTGRHRRVVVPPEAELHRQAGAGHVRQRPSHL